MNRRNFIGGGFIGALAAPASGLFSPVHATSHRLEGDYARPWAIITVRDHPIIDTPQPAYIVYDGPDGEKAGLVERLMQSSYNTGTYAFFSSWKGPYYKRYEGLPR